MSGHDHAITDKGERIAKRLARAGLGSRRDAERWIAEGRVKVNGVVLTSAATLVDETSVIHVDDRPVPEPEPTRVWRYHKPAGLVTTHKDEHGRPTLFETLPPELGRVISVGRLDYNSEGLLLLTNDGEMARRLELPANGWVRRYKVRVHGYVDPVRLIGLESGITIDGIRYGAIKAELERQQGANAWLIIAISEGKNREIRRVMEYLGYPVSRLIRLSYGPFQLGTLDSGGIEEIPRRMVRDQLGMGPVGDKGRKTAPMLTARASVTRNVKAPRPARPAAPDETDAAAPVLMPRQEPVWRPDAKPIARTPMTTPVARAEDMPPPRGARARGAAKSAKPAHPTKPVKPTRPAKPRNERPWTVQDPDAPERADRPTGGRPDGGLTPARTPAQRRSDTLTPAHQTGQRGPSAQRPGSPGPRRPAKPGRHKG